MRIYWLALCDMEPSLAEYTAQVMAFMREPFHRDDLWDDEGMPTEAFDLTILGWMTDTPELLVAGIVDSHIRHSRYLELFT